MKSLGEVYIFFRNMDIEDITKYINEYDIEKSQDINLETILFVIYDLYKYTPSKDTLEDKIKRSLQYKFRESLKQKYSKCVISNRNVEICEACHIIPFCESELENKYNINNGLLLSSDLHKLFDKFMLSINEKMCVQLSKNILNDESYKDYHKYHNKKLNLNKETMKNLSHHYKTFSKLNII